MAKDTSDPLDDWFAGAHPDAVRVARHLRRIHDMIDGGLCAGQTGNMSVMVAVPLKWELEAGLVGDLLEFLARHFTLEQLTEMPALLGPARSIADVIELVMERGPEIWRSSYRHRQAAVDAQSALGRASDELELVIDRCTAALVSAHRHGT